MVHPTTAIFKSTRTQHSELKNEEQTEVSWVLQRMEVGQNDVSYLCSLTTPNYTVFFVLSNHIGKP